MFAYITAPRLVALAITGLLGCVAQAVPVLQVGVPNGSGGYVPYTDVTPDEDTAFTSGTALAAGGVYGPGVVKVGGKYTNAICTSGCLDWSAVKYSGNNFFSTAFDGKGAVMMVSVAEGTLADANANLKINGSSAFATSTSAYWGDNHYPVKDASADFLYFDIGDFTKNTNAVSDFASGSAVGTADGEVKTLALTLGAFAGSWAHFDLMALVTDVQITGQGRTTYTTNNAESPNSHDVTWTKDGSPPPTSIPEPGSLALVSLSLIGAGLVARRKRA